MIPALTAAGGLLFRENDNALGRVINEPNDFVIG